MELKAHWDLAPHMLRGERGIEMLVNLQTIAYAAMRILPLLVPGLRPLQDMSAQEVRSELGRRIEQDLFLKELESRAFSRENEDGFPKTLHMLLDLDDQAA